MSQAAKAAKAAAVMAAVRSTLKPEFLNRLDDVVLFDALSPDELAQIVDLQIVALDQRLTDRRITIEVTAGARECLSTEGFDPANGARPLRRLIQTAIVDPLARQLIAGDVKDGDTVRVDVSADASGLTLTTA